MAETVPVGEMRGLESKHSFATITPGHLDQCLIFSSVRFPVTAPGKVTDLRHRQGGGGWLPISTLNYLSRDGQDGREHLAPLESSRHCESFQPQGNEILSSQR